MPRCRSSLLMVVEGFSKYSLPRIAHRFMLAIYPSMFRERITVIDRFVRYALVGGISTLTYLGMLAFLVEYFDLDPVLGSVRMLKDKDIKTGLKVTIKRPRAT